MSYPETFNKIGYCLHKCKLCGAVFEVQFHNSLRMHIGSKKCKEGQNVESTTKDIRRPVRVRP